MLHGYHFVGSGVVWVRVWKRTVAPLLLSLTHWPNAPPAAPAGRSALKERIEPVVPCTSTGSRNSPVMRSSVTVAFVTLPLRALFAAYPDALVMVDSNGVTFFVARGCWLRHR